MECIVILDIDWGSEKKSCKCNLMPIITQRWISNSLHPPVMTLNSWQYSTEVMHLQDFISDLYSCHAVVYIPWLQNPRHLGVISWLGVLTKQQKNKKKKSSSKRWCTRDSACQPTINKNVLYGLFSTLNNSSAESQKALSLFKDVVYCHRLCTAIAPFWFSTEQH